MFALMKKEPAKDASKIPVKKKEQDGYEFGRLTWNLLDQLEKCKPNVSRSAIGGIGS